MSESNNIIMGQNINEKVSGIKMDKSVSKYSILIINHQIYGNGKHTT